MATSDGPSLQQSGWVSFFELIDTVLDRFGWPGGLLLFGAWFVVHYATPEQKTKIIDMYVLGSGANVHYPVLVLGIVAVIAFLAQRFYYMKKIGLLKVELKRLGKWKTDHQGSEIGGPLHSSEGPEV